MENFLKMKMNISQIKHNEIFNYNKDQIFEKNHILDLHSNTLIVKSNKYQFELQSVLNWFNYYLLTTYKNFEELSRNISEDICILGNVEGNYRLIYINVAFPNRWRPLEKINKNIAEIHAPIPNFENTAKKIENFLQIMDENVPYRRENWGFANSKDLYLPYDKDDKTEEIYKRREIQTLIKINHFIIFLIKTELTKSDKNQLKDLSSNLTKEMKEYKLLNSKL